MRRAAEVAGAAAAVEVAEQQDAVGFIARAEATTGAGLLRFTNYEFDAFLECTILDQGSSLRQQRAGQRWCARTAAHGIAAPRMATTSSKATRATPL